MMLSEESKQLDQELDKAIEEATKTRSLAQRIKKSFLDPRYVYRKELLKKQRKEDPRRRKFQRASDERKVADYRRPEKGKEVIKKKMYELPSYMKEDWLDPILDEIAYREKKFKKREKRKTARPSKMRG